VKPDQTVDLGTVEETTSLMDGWGNPGNSFMKCGTITQFSFSLWVQKKNVLKVQHLDAFLKKEHR
jgi:hypothetical protein